MHLALTKEEFEQLVETALRRLPRVFREKIAQENIVVLVEDEPKREIRNKTKGLILGLFHGVPRTLKSVEGFYYPDRIILYQKNIEAVCSTEQEIEHEVIQVVKHEVGHYFGLDENELKDV